MTACCSRGSSLLDFSEMGFLDSMESMVIEANRIIRIDIKAALNVLTLVLSDSYLFRLNSGTVQRIQTNAKIYRPAEGLPIYFYLVLRYNEMVNLETARARSSLSR